jgi:hypothetical protein
MIFKNEKLYVAMRAYVSAAIDFITQRAEREATSLSVTKEDDYFERCWMTALYTRSHLKNML